jgi:predicted nucleic acid-binding protein
MNTNTASFSNHESRKVCLDTCIISAIAKEELSSSDAQAMIQITKLVESNNVTLCASTHVRDELNKIPLPHRGPHLDVYNSLRRIADYPSTDWIDDDPSSLTFNKPTVHPNFSKIRDIVPGDKDARLLFAAHANKARDFLTLDERTILRFRKQLKDEVGINTWTPSEFIQTIISPTY